MHKQPTVYILASRRNGTLYVGATSDLAASVDAHRRGTISGFTKKCGVTRLVYHEPHASLADAIAREKQMKRWRRAWKIQLIEERNADWRDLFAEVCA